MLAAIVIGLVIDAIGGDLIGQTVDDGIDIGLGRIEIDHQRADLGAQEMVRAGGAQRRQRTQIVGIDEFEHGVAVVEMAQLVAVFRDEAADLRHQAGGDGATLFSRERIGGSATENGLARGLLFKPGNGLVDDGNGGLVAGLGRVAPGEQAVGFEHHALGVRVLETEFFQPQAKLESRFLPGQPADLVTENLLGQLL